MVMMSGCQSHTLECSAYRVEFIPPASSPESNRDNTYLLRSLQSFGLNLDESSICVVRIKGLSFHSQEPFHNVRSGQLKLATSAAQANLEISNGKSIRKVRLSSNASEVQNAYLTEKRNFKQPLIDDISYQILRNISKKTTK